MGDGVNTAYQAGYVLMQTLEVVWYCHRDAPSLLPDRPQVGASTLALWADEYCPGKSRHIKINQRNFGRYRVT